MNDAKPADAATAKQCQQDLDTLYFCVQLYSYPGQYLHEKPSIDRIAETILKFEEDFFGEGYPKGRRRATVTFCEPIMMNDHLPPGQTDAKDTSQQITQQIESAIRNVLKNETV